MINYKVTDTETFIKKCLNIGSKYDYSKVIYLKSKSKVEIICKEHGSFYQTPNNHLKGQDCPKCSNMYFEIKSNFKIIEDFIFKHKDKYDYSKVLYKGNKVKVEIICKEHGSFYQTPNNHLKGQDCPICKTIDTKIFIDRSNKIHLYKYNYDMTIYSNMNDKIKIICKEHGIFEQRASSHIYGSGCPSCKESKGEREIRKILDSLNIRYETQHTFNDCKFKNKLPFDFYLPKYNIYIEYDGEQHFRPIEYYGGINTFNVIKKRDQIKTLYCENNNIEIIRINYRDDIKSKIEECLL